MKRDEMQVKLNETSLAWGGWRPIAISGDVARAGELGDLVPHLPLSLSMHPIWNIPEILAHILSFLDEKSDIFRCTLVCRSLSVEATRQIWRQVSAFRDLLGCFPNNIISTEMSGPSWRLVCSEAQPSLIDAGL